MKQINASIISNSEIMPAVYLTWLECPEASAEARPGQFVMVYCGEETLLRRPLSIHQRDGSKIALLYAVVGKGTQSLSQRQAGDMVDILGPLGNSYSIDPDSHKLLLASGGMGIAPLCFLAQEALKQGHSLTLLYGTANNQRYPENLLPPGIKLVSATEDGAMGYKGMITDLLPDYVDRADQVFACGPFSMYRSINALRKSIRKPVQISLEVRMGCGRGVCYGCTVKTKSGLKQVCQDGPVLDLDDILWDEPELL